MISQQITSSGVDVIQNMLCDTILIMDQPQLISSSQIYLLFNSRYVHSMGCCKDHQSLIYLISSSGFIVIFIYYRLSHHFSVESCHSLPQTYHSQLIKHDSSLSCCHQCKSLKNQNILNISYVKTIFYLNPIFSISCPSLWKSLFSSRRMRIFHYPKYLIFYLLHIPYCLSHDAAQDCIFQIHQVMTAAQKLITKIM